MRNENYTNEVAGGVDRITQILQQNARPVNPLQSQGLNIPPNILNAMLAGSLSGGRPVFEQAMDYQQGVAKDQGDILTAYENKLKMGDGMTKALDDKIQMFVGSDPQAKATILQELHALPEDVDPTNSKTYATIAGIAKKHGLVNLDREIDIQGKLADINYKNALSSRTFAKSSGAASSGQSNASPIFSGDNVMDEKTYKNFVNDSQAYKDFEMNFDRLKQAVSEISSGNVAGITGLSGKIPNRPGSSAADTQAKLENLKSQVGFAVLQAMRDASKTGGALGNITEKEIYYLQNNLASLDTSQSEDSFRRELQQIVQYADDKINDAKRSFELKYGVAPESNTDDPRIKEALDAGYTMEEIQNYLGGQ